MYELNGIVQEFFFRISVMFDGSLVHQEDPAIFFPVDPGRQGIAVEKFLVLVVVLFVFRDVEVGADHACRPAIRCFLDQQAPCMNPAVPSILCFQAVGVEDESSMPTIDKWLERIHPDDKLAVASSIEQITHQSPNSTFEIEYRFRRDDGGAVQRNIDPFAAFLLVQPYRFA